MAKIDMIWGPLTLKRKKAVILRDDIFGCLDYLDCVLDPSKFQIVDYEQRGTKSIEVPIYPLPEGAELKLYIYNNCNDLNAEKTIEVNRLEDVKSILDALETPESDKYFNLILYNTTVDYFRVVEGYIFSNNQ